MRAREVFKDLRGKAKKRMCPEIAINLSLRTARRHAPRSFQQPSKLYGPIIHLQTLTPVKYHNLISGDMAQNIPLTLYIYLDHVDRDYSWIARLVGHDGSASIGPGTDWYLDECTW